MIAFEKIDLTPNRDQSKKGLSQKNKKKTKNKKQSKTKQIKETQDRFTRTKHF